MSDRSVLLKRASAASVCVAVTLMLLKLLAWWLSGSVSLLASLMDSATDILASMINLFAVHLAMCRADNNHHYGHGKAESLSALAQAMFITGSSFFLIINALPRLFAPQPLSHNTIGIVVMLISLSATLALVRYQHFVLKQVDSPSVHADSLHYLSDTLTGMGVLLALVLNSAFNIAIADPILAILIGIYMLYGVYQIVYDAVSALMDVALPEAEMDMIRAAIARVDGYIGVHRLRARKSGAWRIIDMHMEFSDDISLQNAHKINDQVEKSIAACFDAPCEIMIHLEPSNVAFDDQHKIQ